MKFYLILIYQKYIIQVYQNIKIYIYQSMACLFFCFLPMLVCSPCCEKCFPEKKIVKAPRIRQGPPKFSQGKNDGGSNGNIKVGQDDRSRQYIQPYFSKSCGMPCGHTFNKQQVKQHLNNIIKRGEHIIKCPLCQREWIYSQHIEKYLTKPQQINYSDRLSENQAKNLQDYYNKYNPQRSPPLISKQQVSIEIQSITGIKKSLNITNDMTGFIIKQNVAHLFPRLLKPQKMDIFLNNVQIQNNKQIKHILNRSNKPFLVVQKRLSLKKILGLKTKYDDQFGEVTAQMPCTHYISQSDIIGLLNDTISRHKYMIICPQANCKEQWDFDFCKKIAALTEQQQQKFYETLPKILIDQKYSKCPHCPASVYNDTNYNRVICSVCNGPEYCYVCKKNWRTNSFYICGNDDCNIQPAQILQIETKDAIFDLYVDSQRNIQQKKKLPKFRACPKCAQIINYKDQCKHMSCPKCKNSFCWVCLSVKTNDTWLCKGPFDFCGKIAPIQDYAELQKKLKIK